MTTPNLLIFDLDGTLVDSFPGIRLGLNLALEELGAPPRSLDWVTRHVGWGARRLAQAAAADVLDADELLVRFRLHYGEVLVDNTAPYPGVDEALRSLYGRFVLAVASNKPLPWVDDLITHLGWSDLMASVVGPESAGAHKPDAAMIEVVLTETAHARGHALLVGDMPVDAETGRNAGIAVVGVATGSATEEQLLKAGCVAVIDGVRVLPRWLEKAQV